MSSRVVVSVLRRDVGQFNELELSMEGKEKKLDDVSGKLFLLL